MGKISNWISKTFSTLDSRTDGKMSSADREEELQEPGDLTIDEKETADPESNRAMVSDKDKSRYSYSKTIEVRLDTD